MPLLAVTLPSGSYVADPVSAVLAALNWPTTSVCSSVRASTPSDSVPPAAPIATSEVPLGSQV
jgi:hypothetical protein